LGFTYVLGCELTLHDVMPFDFIILFILKKEEKRKEEKNS